MINKRINIGILGSAFNMPTLGHADVVRQALREFDQVWLVPSYIHPFGKTMMDYKFRVELTSAFAQDLRGIYGDRVKCMPVEPLISSKKKPAFSYILLEYFEALNDSYLLGLGDFKLIIGPDNLDNWDKFYKSKEIDEKWGKFVANESKDIRSTKVRNMMLYNQDISNYVTNRVLHLMTDNRIELTKVYSLVSNLIEIK